MTLRESATVAVAVTATALSAYLAGEVLAPAPTKGVVCKVATVRGVFLGKTTYNVMQTVKAIDAGTETTPGYDVVVGSERVVPCASLLDSTKRAVAVPPFDPACVTGEWRRSDGGTGLGRCCEAGCRCKGRCVPTVPSVIAGLDPTAEELCSAVPETCAKGKP